MSLPARIKVLPEERLGRINPNIYGHFVEHLGRCIYGGVWAAERDEVDRVVGYREDVLEAVKALRVPVLRYPGGCFSDGYHWKDGIGPRDQRPTVFDTAWKAQEPNAFGTDEFLRYCDLIGAQPYLNVNFGSGSVAEALDWLQYCNSPAETRWGSRRATNGRAEPYRVRYWGIGNEICGDWEIGHTDARTYGQGFIEYQRAMKAVDPGLKLVAVGWDETMPNWNPQVVEVAGEYIDYLSIHHYVPGGVDLAHDSQEFYYAIVASPLSTEQKLVWTRKVIEENLRGPHQVEIVLDEWNLWLSHPPESPVQDYRLRDGLYAAAMFHVLHRQCAQVTMANLAQLVNVLGAILTDKTRMALTPIYWAFALYAPRTGEWALRTETEVDGYAQEAMGSITAIPHAPYLDVSATLSEERGLLYIGVVNRHWEEPIRAAVEIAPLVAKAEGKLAELNGPDPLAANTLEGPPLVRITETSFLCEGSRFEHIFPAHSASILEIPL